MDFLHRRLHRHPSVSWAAAVLSHERGRRRGVRELWPRRLEPAFRGVVDAANPGVPVGRRDRHGVGDRGAAPLLVSVAPTPTPVPGLVPDTGEGAALGAVPPLEIQRAFRFLERDAAHRVGINHRGAHVAVPQQLLDGANVVVGLQQVAGEAVAQGVRGGPLGDSGAAHRVLDRLLHQGLVQMIAPTLVGIGYGGQRHGRKQPLPRQFLGRARVFLPQRGR